MSSLKSFDCAVSALKILTFEAVLDRREGGVRILSPASYIKKTAGLYPKEPSH